MVLWCGPLQIWIRWCKEFLWLPRSQQWKMAALQCLTHSPLKHLPCVPRGRQGLEPWIHRTWEVKDNTLVVYIIPDKEDLQVLSTSLVLRIWDHITPGYDSSMGGVQWAQVSSQVVAMQPARCGEPRYWFWYPQFLASRREQRSEHISRMWYAHTCENPCPCLIVTWREGPGLTLPISNDWLTACLK